MGIAGFLCQPEGLSVHEGEHQDIAGDGVLSHNGNDAIYGRTAAPRVQSRFGLRTGIPCLLRWARASATRYSPKWNIDAASTASARPGANASTI